MTVRETDEAFYAGFREQLDHTRRACRTYREVQRRYPDYTPQQESAYLNGAADARANEQFRILGVLQRLGAVS